MGIAELEGWRNAMPVLVPEAQALGSIGVIRSLGRCGYPVVAAASDGSALGLKSTFARVALVHPPEDSNEFVPWLRNACARYGIRAIVPSEGFLHAIREHFSEFAPLMPVAGDERSVYALLSKYDLFRRLVAPESDPHLPRLVFLEDRLDSATRDSLESLGYPQFAKFDHAYARFGADNVVRKLEDPVSASAVIGELLSRYRCGLVQENCAGVGVGVFLLRWDGVEIAQFMHRRLHEVPYTGGASSYRRAWNHELILADARARAAKLHYQGVGMFEYRWSPDTGRFCLVELNARFWGSLHLALFAGVDFPRLLLDSFFGRPVTRPEYSLATRCRNTFPGEIDYLRSCLKAKGLPASTKLNVLVEFALLSLNPQVHADYWFPGDRLLYFRQIRRAVQKYLR